MKLYLVRHGEAVSEYEDPKRPLTENGRQEVLKVAVFLKKADVYAHAIWHSTKLRTKQTAEIFAKTMDFKKNIEECRGLNPDDAPQFILERIVSLSLEKDSDSILIAGHLPFLPRLVSLLLTAAPSFDLLAYPTASAACLEGKGHGPWQLRWMVTPDLIP